MRRYLPRLAPLAILLVAACGEYQGGGGTRQVSTSVCSSGLAYSGGGEEGGGTMNPGMDCIACHSRGEGPVFDAAGTVFGDYHDQNGCVGAAGVMVKITDANGQTYQSITNATGNFYFWGTPFAFPIHAQVSYGGKTHAMVTAQATADCAACHTQTGQNGAPGRIVSP